MANSGKTSIFNTVAFTLFLRRSQSRLRRSKLLGYQTLSIGNRFNFLFSLLLEVHFFYTPGCAVRTVHHLLVLLTVLVVLACSTQSPHVVDRVRPGRCGNFTWKIPTLIEQNTLFVMISLIPVSWYMRFF